MGFWPNSEESTHHRSEDFRNCFLQVQTDIREIFDLSTEEWDVLLVPMNGSLAIESVIRTFGGKVQVQTDGAFSQRVAQVHHDPHAPWSFGVQHETNDSRLCDISQCDIVDAVSALPYFDFPRQAKVVITVSSKQFGAATIWSLVMVRRNFWEQANPLKGYLDLQRYRDFAMISETPCTPSISALFSLEEKLRGFDLKRFRDRINDRYQRLSEVIIEVGGEIKGGRPVLTFRLPQSLEIITDQLWYPPGSEGWMQAFMWSGSDSEVEEMRETLSRLKASQI